MQGVRKYRFEDISLQKIFQEDFENFIKENFRLASNYKIHKIWDYLQKFQI